MKFHCPTCDLELITGAPHQDDVEGYCCFCNVVWNINTLPADDNEPCPQWLEDLLNRHYGREGN